MGKKEQFLLRTSSTNTKHASLHDEECFCIPFYSSTAHGGERLPDRTCKDGIRAPAREGDTNPLRNAKASRIPSTSDGMARILSIRRGSRMAIKEEQERRWDPRPGKRGMKKKTKRDHRTIRYGLWDSKCRRIAIQFPRERKMFGPSGPSPNSHHVSRRNAIRLRG